MALTRTAPGSRCRRPSRTSAWKTTRKTGLLKDKGCRLALDDFGTGYSSLSYLRRFPIDTLKIDKPFIDGVTTSPEGRAVVAAITQLGQTLHLEVVAQGLETPE